MQKDCQEVDFDQRFAYKVSTKPPWYNTKNQALGYPNLRSNSNWLRRGFCEGCAIESRIYSSWHWYETSQNKFTINVDSQMDSPAIAVVAVQVKRQ